MPPKRPAGAHEQPCELCAKLVVVGEAFVGKSCLAARVSKDEFSPTQEPTIGAAFVSYRTTISNPNYHTTTTTSGGGAPSQNQRSNTASSSSASSPASIGSSSGSNKPGFSSNDSEVTVKFEIWDTAGQERFRSLTPMYFRGAVAGLVVYDVSSADTLRKARTWIQDLRKTRDSLAIVLVGNKADLPDDKRQVTAEEGEAVAEEENIGFFETSAKTGQNVKDVFNYVAKEVVARNLAQPAKQPVGVSPMNQPRGGGGGGSSGGGSSTSGRGGSSASSSGGEGSGKKCDKC